MPLLFDMPWEELQTYEGRNPKPADFDSFWDKGLREIDAIDPQTELTPSAFQTSFADCLDMYFTGAQGARIHAKLIRPKHAHEQHPAVLLFHGYSGSSGDWSDKLGYAAAGFTVAALDCRGQAGLSEDAGAVKGPTMRGQIIRGLEDSPEKLLFRQIFLDTVQLARIVMAMPEVDSARVGAGAPVIDSSICVATITGTPLWRAARIMAFCATGTSSGSSSTPRSPRATITPSE